MRILVINEYLNIVGGAETYLKALLPKLISLGHSVALAVSNSSINAESIAPPGMQQWSVSDFAASKAWRPDVVFANGLADAEIELQYSRTFPTYLYAHNYFGTCISGNKCHSNHGYRTCERALGAGCLLAYLPWGCGGMNPIRMLSLYQTQRKRLVSLSSYRSILVASKHMHSEYVRNGIESKRVSVVPLFPSQQIRDSQLPKQRPRSDQLLVVSRFTQLKGVQFVAEAVRLASERLNRNLSLRIAGDGPARAKMEVTLNQSRINYTFLGWLDATERESEMRSSDLLVFPSVWPEPFGLVGIEAGCVGLPAVGFGVGGTVDWLRPGISGEVTDGYKDSEALSKAIVKALQYDSHWQSLRQGAWKVSGDYTASSHCKKLLEMFQKT